MSRDKSSLGHSKYETIIGRGAVLRCSSRTRRGWRGYRRPWHRLLSLTGWAPEKFNINIQESQSNWCCTYILKIIVTDWPFPCYGTLGWDDRPSALLHNWYIFLLVSDTNSNVRISSVSCVAGIAAVIFANKVGVLPQSQYDENL